jgi:CrcB protein
VNILLIGIGGGLGAITRYLFSIVVSKFDDSTFPLATFAVNLIGCFIVGYIIAAGLNSKEFINNFFVIGFLGSFTTMSAFSNQTLELFSSNQPLIGFLYIISTIAFTLAATYVGLILGR